MEKLKAFIVRLQATNRLFIFGCCCSSNVQLVSWWRAIFHILQCNRKCRRKWSHGKERERDQLQYHYTFILIGFSIVCRRHSVICSSCFRFMLKLFSEWGNTPNRHWENSMFILVLFGFNRFKSIDINQSYKYQFFKGVNAAGTQAIVINNANSKYTSHSSLTQIHTLLGCFCNSYFIPYTINSPDRTQLKKSQPRWTFRFHN